MPAMFTLIYAPKAAKALAHLRSTDARRHRKVAARLARLSADPRDPSLNNHPVQGADATAWGSQLWFAYLETSTPAAWRAVWAYGPERGQISVLWAGPHP